ncbi:MAG: AAA family ATPase [Clostridia bacterium]|nr:AAA family ATPase [Clostridia bacterium]
MKKKDQRISRFQKKIRVILAVCIVFGGLLVASVVASVFKEDGLKNYEIFARSETVYVMIILAIALLVLLFFMLLAVRKRNRENEYLPAYLCERAKSVLDESQYADGENLVELEPVRGAELPFTEEAENESTEASEEKSPDGEEEAQPRKVEREPRFYNLSELDKQASVAKRYAGVDSLAELCERFRRYCATEKQLYYTIEDVRCFVASLTVTKLIVMQGMSGTGKTSMACAFGDFLGNPSLVVPVQPMWKERSDLIGYFNEFTGRFNETNLLRKMYEANCNTDEIYVTVLDEMNIARVEYYFAEFLSLLELEEGNQELDVVSDSWENDPRRLRNGKIELPQNMWFMGTVNNDDSTFAISDKVYDRAMVMNFDRKCEPFDCEGSGEVRISAEQFGELVREARAKYAVSDRNMRRIEELDRYLIEKFYITFGNRINRQLAEYVPAYIACGGDELEAIDGILAKKVFRKLDSKNPVRIKSEAEELQKKLDELFGEGSLPLCREYVKKKAEGIL